MVRRVKHGGNNELLRLIPRKCQVLCTAKCVKYSFCLRCMLYIFMHIESIFISTLSFETHPALHRCPSSASMCVLCLEWVHVCVCVCVRVCACVRRFQFAIISDRTSLIPTEGRVVGRRELLLLHTRQADYLSTGLNPGRASRFLCVLCVFVCACVQHLYGHTYMRQIYLWQCNSSSLEILMFVSFRIKSTLTHTLIHKQSHPDIYLVFLLEEIGQAALQPQQSIKWWGDDITRTWTWVKHSSVQSPAQSTLIDLITDSQDDWVLVVNLKVSKCFQRGNPVKSIFLYENK